MRVLISIANYKIGFLFILYDMLIYFTLDRENILIRFRKSLCVCSVDEPGFCRMRNFLVPFKKVLVLAELEEFFPLQFFTA